MRSFTTTILLLFLISVAAGYKAASFVRTPNAVLEQQLRCSKALFIFKVIGDYRLTGAQSEPGWRFKIGADGRYSHDTLVPTYAGAHQKSILRGDVLQDLAEFRLHSLGRKTRSVISVGQ